MATTPNTFARETLTWRTNKPPVEERILVSLKHPAYFKDVYVGEVKQDAEDHTELFVIIEGGGSPRADFIEAWMPLPPAYKKETP